MMETKVETIFQDWKRRGDAFPYGGHRQTRKNPRGQRSNHDRKEGPGTGERKEATTGGCGSVLATTKALPRPSRH